MKPDLKPLEKSILGISGDDKYTAEFYLHKVIAPDNQSMIEAKQKADKRAYLYKERTGKDKEPDYTPANLKRLGATQDYMIVPYVIIRRMGAKDYKSHPVADDHKQQFPDEWAAFKEQENEYFRERRQVVRAEENRQRDKASGADWGSSEGVSYTPTPYSISFG